MTEKKITSEEAIFTSIEFGDIVGLTDEEAAKRFQRDGPNEILRERVGSIWSVLRGTLSEPVFILLLTGALLYIIIGDLIEGLVLLSFICVIVIIDIYQEARSSRAVEALRAMSSPRANVLRSGIGKRITGCKVVVDDILFVAAGDIIPADALLLSANNLKIDESLLTGESLPIEKIPASSIDKLDGSIPAEEKIKFIHIYAGTRVVAGRAIARVLTIGKNTEMGRISQSLREIKQEDTPLQKQTKVVVRRVGLVALISCLVVIFYYYFWLAEIVPGILAGISLALALIPEEFPIVLTIFLALGAYRIASKNVLTRRVPAIEALGAVTVLCTDKTGTLTENKMKVVALAVFPMVKTISSIESEFTEDIISIEPITEEGDQCVKDLKNADLEEKIRYVKEVSQEECAICPEECAIKGAAIFNLAKIEEKYKKIYGEDDQKAEMDLPYQLDILARYAVLASEPNPFDPMELAFYELANRYVWRHEELAIPRNWKILKHYELSSELPATTHIWTHKDSDAEQPCIVSMKGAPESVLDLCHMLEDEAKIVERTLKFMASEGLRILGVAGKEIEHSHYSELPEKQHDFKFRFLGLLGLHDPPRAESTPAIAQCYNAGIRVMMVTGDHPETAAAIGKAIGLSFGVGNHEISGVITGKELAQLKTLNQDKEILRDSAINIISRVSPDQKLDIVKDLKETGEFVAMTGDGVNDAAALKAADVGVAMGARGTDVAREAADLVLVQDDFASLTASIEQGRRIFDNIRKAMMFIIIVHVPIVILSIVPLFLGFPGLLAPIHIVLLELIIDPACTLVFENEPADADVMSRPPRKIDTPIISKVGFGLSLLQGVVIGVGLLGIIFYLTIRFPGCSIVEIRTATILALIVANLTLILTSRSMKQNFVRLLFIKNRMFWILIIFVIFLSSLIFTIPVLRDLFLFTSLSFEVTIIAIVVGLSSALWIEAFKPLLGSSFK
ncbi:MAG: cation-translocating P-type ATPase [Candidatus Helarchaeota archaeon]|nr:cation-translocating P-type ATPase [Candidatus Helarchaeota archaeon]